MGFIFPPVLPEHCLSLQLELGGEERGVEVELHPPHTLFPFPPVCSGSPPATRAPLPLHAPSFAAPKASANALPM